MAGSVTVKDVAQAADVSVATVSRVLNNHANVKEEVRKRVLKAAETLGYTNASNQNSESRVRPLKDVAFVYSSSIDRHPVISNPFWSRILNGAEREANKFNLKLTYRSVGDLVSKPQLLINTIKEMQVDGILLVGPAEAETVRLVQSLNLPLIMIDNYLPGLGVDSVLSDNFEGARRAVQFIIEQGHTSIAFIGGPLRENSPRPINKVYTIERRASGYRTAMLDAGLKFNYQLYESAELAPESAYEATKRLLTKNVKFSALFCANDELAIGAMKALREAKLHIPDDISVMGFDDIELAEHFNPALTTVRVNKEAMGAAAVKALLSRAADPTAASVTIMLDVGLVQRDSVRTLHNTKL